MEFPRLSPVVAVMCRPPFAVRWMRRRSCAWEFTLRNRVPPFPHHSRGSIFRRWRKLPTTDMRRRTPAGRKPKPARDPAKHSKKDPARPTRAKASRPDLPPTDAGARRAAQSRHRPGHRGAGLADRPASRRPTIRSTAAPISPPRTGRASRRRRDSARRRRRATAARAGPRGRDATGHGSRAGAGAGFRARRRRADQPAPRTRTPSRPFRGITGAAATGAGAGDAAARGPPGIRRAAVDAAPPAAAGKIRGRPAAGDPDPTSSPKAISRTPSPTWSKA